MRRLPSHPDLDVCANDVCEAKERTVMWPVNGVMSSRAIRRGPWLRDEGMSTAEYAVGTIAAAALAMVLYQVVTSGAVSDALQGLVERALDAEQ